MPPPAGADAGKDATPQRLIAPCVTSCPAGIDVPRYIGLVEKGRFADAAAVVRETIPLPSACGYICYRPCEPWCRRGVMEAPVAINAIKRAAMEHDTTAWRERLSKDAAPPTGRSVAIVGSGPAGLTAAYYLSRRKGHSVTIFEAEPEMGGQLRIGLPEYRLPRNTLREEIELITQRGVGVKTNTRVESLDDLFSSGYQAVLLAVGSTRPRPMGIEGESLPGVGYASRFLRDVNLGNQTSVEGRVLVLGCDNVALDAARCAVRLGARQVVVAFHGAREDAPGLPFEIAAAEEEGVRFLVLASPQRIASKGRCLSVAMARCRLVPEGKFGRARAEPVPGDTFAEEADLVLVSAGRSPAVPRAWGLDTTPDGLMRVDPQTLGTSRIGVFAAGDCVTGPDSIVQAMAQGRRAAQALDRYLGGDGDIGEVFAPPPGDEMEMPAHLAEQGKPPIAMPQAELAQRTRSFALVERGYSKADALAEARRCIRCDLWRVAAPEVWLKQG